MDKLIYFLICNMKTTDGNKDTAVKLLEIMQKEAEEEYMK